MTIGVDAAGTGEVAGSTRFLIFPIENLTKNRELEWISDGLSLSIADQVRIPGVQAVEKEDRLGLLEGADLPPNAPISHASMIRLAQLASADYLVVGSFSGKSDNLRVSLRILDLKTMKFGGEITATGPVTALPQIENELAWILLSNTNNNKIFSRQKFIERTRAIPNQAYALYVRALGQADPDVQITTLHKAIQLFEDIPDAQYRLGTYYYNKSDYPKAIVHLEMARSRQRIYLDCLFLLGTSYLYKDKLDEAIRCYETLNAFGQYFESLNNLATAYARKRDLPLALQNLVAAHNLARGDSIVGFNLGLLRYLEGNMPAARAVLERALQLQPRDSLTHFVLGLVLKNQGENEKAEEAFGIARITGVDRVIAQSEDPADWMRLFTSWHHPADSPEKSEARIPAPPLNIADFDCSFLDKAAAAT